MGQNQVEKQEARLRPLVTAGLGTALSYSWLFGGPNA